MNVISKAGELFIIVNNWTQRKYPSIDEWIKKMWCLHIMEYYSAIKENEVLIHGTTQKTLNTLC